MACPRIFSSRIFCSLFGFFSIAMHEAAEIGLARSTLQSKDRRWFLDGMANYIAREYIRKIAGDEGAEAVWRTAYASVTKADAIRKAD